MQPPGSELLQPVPTGAQAAEAGRTASSVAAAAGAGANKPFSWPVLVAQPNSRAARRGDDGAATPAVGLPPISPPRADGSVDGSRDAGPGPPRSSARLTRHHRHPAEQYAEHPPQHPPERLSIRTEGRRNTSRRACTSSRSAQAEAADELDETAFPEDPRQQPPMFAPRLNLAPKHGNFSSASTSQPDEGRSSREDQSSRKDNDARAAPERRNCISVGPQLLGLAQAVEGLASGAPVVAAAAAAAAAAVAVDPGQCFTVLDGLGAGGFSMVVLVERSDTRKRYAMKVLSKARLARPRYQRFLQNELSALQVLHGSPFVQRLHCAFETPSEVFIVSEFLAGGDLFYHLQQRCQQGQSGVSEVQCRTLLAELVLAVGAVHAAGLVHRDIKIENIMLSRRGHIKLVDFGLAQTVGDCAKRASGAGSIIYMSPELLQHGQCSLASDWWAVGVVAHELLTGSSPWSTLHDKQMLKLEITTRNVQPPPSASPGAGMLVWALLQRDLAHRLSTAAAVKQAPFFHGLDWAAAERLELPPAVAPPQRRAYFEPQDCAAVLEAYRAAAPQPVQGWTLGVPAALFRPPCAR